MKDLIRKAFKKKPALEIDMQIQDIEQQREEKRAKRFEIAQSLSEIALTGTEDEFNAVDESTTGLLREIKRLDMQLEGLKQEFETAVERESKEHIDKVLAKAQAASDYGVKVLREYTEKHAPAIRDIAGMLDVIQRVVRQANQIAGEAGDPRRAEAPVKRVCKDTPYISFNQILLPHPGGEANGSFLPGGYDEQISRPRAARERLSRAGIDLDLTGDASATTAAAAD